MADTTIVFYGIRIQVDDDDLEALEARSHPLLAASKSAGLDTYWGIFDEADEAHLLFVGKLLGKLGVEDCYESHILGDDLIKVTEETSKRLRKAGISGTITLYLQYHPDV
jgi:hypothetical protein